MKFATLLIVETRASFRDEHEGEGRAYSRLENDFRLGCNLGKGYRPRS